MNHPAKEEKPKKRNHEPYDRNPSSNQNEKTRQKGITTQSLLIMSVLVNTKVRVYYSLGNVCSSQSLSYKDT